MCVLYTPKHGNLLSANAFNLDETKVWHLIKGLKNTHLALGPKIHIDFVIVKIVSGLIACIIHGNQLVLINVVFLSPADTVCV